LVVKTWIAPDVGEVRRCEVVEAADRQKLPWSALVASNLV
jgi:hypothetical protein